MKVFINEVGQVDSQLKMLGDMIRQRFVPNSQGQMPTFEVNVDVSTKRRTATQNDALQVYCRELGNALNDAGLDMRIVLKPEVEIPWSLKSVKDYIWRPVQKALTGKESTRDPTTTEYQEIYETVNRHIAGKHGVCVPWPSRFNKE